MYKGLILWYNRAITLTKGKIMALTKIQKQKLTMLFTDMDRKDLNLVADLHKQTSRFLSRNEASKFVVGDEVEFTSGSSLIRGIVEKVNVKTINVSFEFGRNWRVSPSLLTKIA